MWKTFLGLLFLVLTPLASPANDYGTLSDNAPAPGVGQWTPLGGGYYQGSSGLWRAYSYYDCGCRKWRYERVPCITPGPIQSPETFDDRLLADYVKVIGWCRNERLLNDFKAATAGICGDQQPQYASSQTYGSRTVTTGYGAQGQTYAGIAGSAVVTPAIVTDNLALAGHTQARMMERTMDLTQQVQAGINYSYLQAGELQKNQAVLSLAFAALQRTPESETVTYGTTTQPLPGSVGMQSRASMGGPGGVNGIVDAGTKFLIEAGRNLNSQSCLACHSPNSPNGPAKGLILDAQSVATLDPKTASELHSAIAGHLAGALKPQMPYKRQGLNAAQQTAYLAWFDSLAASQYSAVANPDNGGSNGGYVEAPPAPPQAN